MSAVSKTQGVIDEPHIVPRVKVYLEENVEKTYVDVSEMVAALRQRYPEYGARPQKKFRKLVEQAYRIVSLSYGIDFDTTSNNDSDGSDVELMDESAATGKNMMKNIMNDLYTKGKSSGTNSKKDAGSSKSTSGTEAIDISSDEDDDDDEKQAGSSAASTKKTTEPTVVQNLLNKNIPARLTITPALPIQISQTNGVSKDVANSHGGHAGQKRRETDRADGGPAKKFISNSQQLPSHVGDTPLASAALENFRNELSGSIAGVKNRAAKKFKKVVEMQRSTVSFQNMGGIDTQAKELCDILIHVKVPDIYYELGVIPPRGILIHGPSGSGKTMLATAIAGQLTMPIMKVHATELIGGVSGESEENIRDIFEQARISAPCVLFIDDIDTISTNRTYAQKEMERRVVSQLINCIDSLRSDTASGDVVLLGATSRPDALDPALRREGRFDHEIAMTIPNRKERKDILRVVCEGMRVDQKLDYDKIAELTPGYVSADLVALASRSATIAVKKKWTEQMRKLKVQRPITIVDLDEIDESIPGEDAKDTSNAKENNKNAITENSNDSAKDNSEKEAEAETKTISKDKETSGDVNPKANGGGGEGDAAVNDEKMDVDNGESKEEGKKEKTDKQNVKLDDDEPTLAEMINWLDIPPEYVDLDDFCVTMQDFLDAVKVLQPSAKREGFITVPDVTWDDIGSLHDIRDELRLAILAPVQYPEAMIRLGLEAPSGVLLCGPPGCGKTLIAKAIANEAGINFISVKGPEMMNMYVGESERAVRECFQRARNSAPCVIFFDEFDSLCPKRSQSNESGSGTRIVNQLLTEMDGVQERRGVYVMAASNRPDIIDPAILRPGRLDSILYVGMPETKDRHEILIAATKNRTNPLLADDVDLMDIAERTEGFSGADLAGLLRLASILALKGTLDDGASLKEVLVAKQNFYQALKSARPSISEQDRKLYNALRAKYGTARYNV